MSSAVPDPSLPHAPESVQKWLRQEDWEALTKAWQEAEAQAIAWADASDNEEARMEELYQEASHVCLQPSVSTTSLPPLSRPGKQKRRKTKQWDEQFGLMGKDTGKPPALRRYFDATPSETRGARGSDSNLGKAKPFKLPEHLASRRNWVDTHHQTVSPDNEALHPHLRSYFDRRGLESCYRQRPHVNATTKLFPPRTPQRPSTREKIMRFRTSLSEPSLASGSIMSNSNQSEGMEEESRGVEGRHTGGVNWGERCQMLGTADYKVKTKDRAKGSASPQKIPWVKDHHVSVALDNTILNPMLRHYFDADGLESSFRNRGQHYGRPPRDAIGLELHNMSLRSNKKNGGADAFSASGYDSVRSDLLEQAFPGTVGNAYGGAYISSGEDDTPP
jgi:hypothetical protein